MRPFVRILRFEVGEAGFQSGCGTGFQPVDYTGYKPVPHSY